MRYKNYILIASGAALLMFACGKKYLEKEALGQLYERTIANKRGVERLLIGAYSLLDGIGSPKSGWFSSSSNWLYGSICGSEAYTGSEFNDGPTNDARAFEKFSGFAISDAVASKWGTVYDGVQRANDVLRIMAMATDISPADQKRIAAEARFLRAHYHFEAKKIWDQIPFIDETITYGNNNYHVSNEKDAWPDIENDLKYAMSNLSETPYQGSPGRATKFTAMALLAKAYLFQAYKHPEKFAAARPLLEAIIHSGKFRLGKYHDNFNPETKNSKESIFSVQMSVNDGSGGLNGNFGDVLNFPMGGPGACCGFFCPSQYLVNHFKTDAATGLPDLDHFNEIDVKHDNGLTASQPFIPDTRTLDPRLDWTVGRRGIPYLDWGLVPGGSWTNADPGWVRDTILDGPYSPKKNVYYHHQQSKLTDAAFWTSGTTTNNVNLIRYADILLWAAEVEVETGNLNKAREYVNLVRKRAADSTGWVYTYVDPGNPSLGFTNTPAANYKVGEYLDPWTDEVYARKAVRFERVLELGMEGHRFFDLVRWGSAATEIKAYLDVEKTKRTYLNDAVFDVNCNEYFPIPQMQIDLSAGADGVRKMVQSRPCY